MNKFFDQNSINYLSVLFLTEKMKNEMKNEKIENLMKEFVFGSNTNNTQSIFRMCG